MEDAVVYSEQIAHVLVSGAEHKSDLKYINYELTENSQCKGAHQHPSRGVRHHQAIINFSETYQTGGIRCKWG
jgi:hypothetical protein